MPVFYDSSLGLNMYSALRCLGTKNILKVEIVVGIFSMTQVT